MNPSPLLIPSWVKEKIVARKNIISENGKINRHLESCFFLYFFKMKIKKVTDTKKPAI
jgi:hypothetical protein